MGSTFVARRAGAPSAPSPTKTNKVATNAIVSGVIGGNTEEQAAT